MENDIRLEPVKSKKVPVVGSVPLMDLFRFWNLGQFYHHFVHESFSADFWRNYARILRGGSPNLNVIIYWIWKKVQSYV